MLDESIVDTATVIRRLEPPHLYARGVSVEGTRVSGRLELAARCQRERVDTVERTVREDVGLVDDDGELASLQAKGGAQIGLGLLMPIATPICYAAGCGDDDDRDDPEPTIDGVKVAFIVGSVLGGLLVLSGIVDVARGGVDEGEPRVEPLETQRSDLGEPFECEASAPDYAQAILQVGAATAAVDLRATGVFSQDVTPLADAIVEAPDARWRLALPDGRGVFLDVPAEDRYRLAGVLGAGDMTKTSTAAR